MGIVPEDVAKNFIEHFGLDGFLDEVLRAFLQGGGEYFPDNRREETMTMRASPCWRTMRSTDSDAFHLRHGDVHEDNVGIGCG